MSRFQAALRAVPRDLNSVGAHWALVGAMAVSARTVSRFTADIDVAVAVSSDSEAEEIVRKLVARGYALSAVLEDTDSGRVTTVRLNYPPADAAPLIVDLLFATSGIENEIVGAATTETVMPAVRLPVATIGHLLAMKVLAESPDRQQDAGDIQRLLEVADQAVIEQAREALLLIQQRGFNRDKDLSSRFEVFLARRI